MRVDVVYSNSCIWFVVRSMRMLHTTITTYTMKTTNRKMDTKVWMAHVTFGVPYEFGNKFFNFQ